MAAGALEGIIVADFSRVLSGPWATMTLGDLGAKVIKVEAPEGDETRGWGPPFVKNESAYFLSTNRNKMSLRLDLTNKDDREVAETLVAKSDVVIENFRPGTMDKFGLGEARCRELSGGVIYCSITGYGPNSRRPGYDAVIQARGGIMSITGPAGGEPAKVGVAVADITAGLYATIGILAALYERSGSGQGQRVDGTLLGAQVAWLANQGSNALNAGVVPERMGTAHPSIVPYQCFHASDGIFMLAVANESIWRRFCEAIAPDLQNDERFINNQARVTNRHSLVEVLSGLFRGMTRNDVIATLEQAEVPVAPVNDLGQVFEDSAVKDLHLVQRVPHTTLGSVSQVRFPVDLSRTPSAIRSAPPTLGEHDQEILSWLGFSEEFVEKHAERHAKQV